MKKVIAIIDIGKTNKKIFLFDEKLNVVFNKSKRFEEIIDDDGFPCDDIDAIENWIQNEIKKIQKTGDFQLKAINFSTHGATLVYLNEDGQRITPLYNYLKKIDLEDFKWFYELNGGVEEFSRNTASPAYGMLNAGLQMLWLKYKKPKFWKEVHAILHYPQYLSYLFTKKLTADFTSIGAHTATWDFDKMKYHEWINKEDIKLPEPCNGKEAIVSNVNGESIAVGTGLHDSSSSIIPILNMDSNKDFVLLSTGTWIITMNPFSKESLSQYQLKNNCLCFMTPDKQQVKSSMQFLGRTHEVYLEAFSEFFEVSIETYLELDLNEALCKELISKNERVFLEEGIDTDFESHSELLLNFTSYEKAYYQLVYEISKKVINAIELISDENSTISDIYISGGFNRNEVFVKFLSLQKPTTTIRIPDVKNESALGAALLMKDYL